MTQNNLTTEQQEKLKDVGSNLHRIRTNKNLSLKRVAADTHISPRLLEAIEAGNCKELPEPFYIQALVSKYARYLGAEEISLEIEPQTKSATAVTNLHGKRRSFGFNLQLRPFHLYLIYVLLVIASVKVITSLVEQPAIVDRPPGETPKIEPEIEPEPSPTPTVVQQPKTTPQFVSQSSDSETVSVGINLQERCWLKVMVDGQVAFEGTLPKGTQRQWTGQKQVTIRAGNAGGVVISFNNQQQKILGAPGQVEEVTYRVN